MQSITPLVCAAFLFASALACGEGPTTGWIVSGGAEVMSGPGDAYYAVAAIAGGTAVEVHGQEALGWFAIRPPAGSFSLVSAADVDELTDGMGCINRDGTRARVGSEFSTRHDAMHVELRAGELVHVLGADPQQPTWLRIAPPAGEFRWVRAGDLSFQPVAAEAVTSADSGDGSWRSRESGRESGRVTLVAATTDAPASNRYAPVATNNDAPPPFVPQPLPTTNAPPQSMTTATAEPVAAAPSSTPNPAATAATDTTAVPSTTTIDDTIDAIEVAIAMRVSEPVSVWKLDDIEQKVAGLLALTSDPEQQQVLRDIALRLDRFAKIQRGYQATREMPQTATQTSQIPAMLPAIDDGITPLEPAATSANKNPLLGNFDAIGVLRPVVSKRAGAPPYALVDDEGRIVTFVTPSPSLNVQPMLGRKVGVSGTRGFMPEYQQRHVATARIEAMPAVLRR